MTYFWLDGGDGLSMTSLPSSTDLYIFMVDENIIGVAIPVLGPLATSTPV
jgi:hypothetical protein